jgi:hypothetical protein
MKRFLLLAMVMLSVFLMGASEKDNIYATSGSILTSSGDGLTWNNLGATSLTSNSTIRLSEGQMQMLTFSGTANAAEAQKRYVSVWIIDQDDNVPLSKSILYEKTMLFTDRTPDEIRADIPLLKLLEKHNEVREILKDKEGKPLKKIRLRDVQIRILSW